MVRFSVVWSNGATTDQQLETNRYTQCIGQWCQEVSNMDIQVQGRLTMQQIAAHTACEKYAMVFVLHIKSHLFVVSALRLSAIIHGFR